MDPRNKAGSRGSASRRSAPHCPERESLRGFFVYTSGSVLPSSPNRRANARRALQHALSAFFRLLTAPLIADRGAVSHIFLFLPPPRLPVRC